MRQLDPDSVLSAGGWNPRYAVTLAVAENEGVGGALIDANGDLADIDLDLYERDADGHWHAGVSGGVGEEGTTWSDRVAATWGRAEPHQVVHVEYRDRQASVVVSTAGWWLFVVRSTPNPSVVPRRSDTPRSSS